MLLHFFDVPLIEYPLVYVSLHNIQRLFYTKMLCYVIIFGIVATLSVDRYNYNDSIMESIENSNDMAKHRNLVG